MNTIMMIAVKKYFNTKEKQAALALLNSKTYLL